jgi:nucleotide-binding universal stress UspA family protein
MSESRDYLGETLRLVERAREDVYFRQLDQELINQMRQKDAAQAAAVEPTRQVFTPVLIPVDFSPHAATALEYAADIAERFGSSLIVLHVLDRDFVAHATQQRLRLGGSSVPGTAATSGPGQGEREAVEAVISDQREQVYKALTEFLPPRLARYPVELRVVVGHPFERIVETAVHEKAGLIVMGTHGRTGLSHMATGSVAERVVRMAPCPVMTVKPDTPETTSWLQGFYETFIRPTAY